LSPYGSAGFVPHTMRLCNSLTQCNSTTAKQVLHADVRLSSRSDDCWSSNIFSAMTGLVQEYMFKEKLRNCEPVDFSRFVVDLSRERDTWSFGHPILMAHESTTAKFSIIQMVCTAPQKGPGYSFSLQPFLIHIPRPPTRCHLQCCPFQTVCPHPLL